METKKLFKNLKRRLSGMLCLVMLLGCTTSAWADCRFYEGTIYFKSGKGDYTMSKDNSNEYSVSFYCEKSDTEFWFKINTNNKWYSSNGYSYHKDWTGNPGGDLCTDGGDDHIKPNQTTSSGWLKINVSLYLEYGGKSKIKQITQTAVSSISPSVSISGTSPRYTGTAYTLTGSATGGSESYKYEFFVNGTSQGSASSTNTKSWTPSSAGTYKIKVKVTDNNCSGLSATSSETSVTITAACTPPTIDSTTPNSRCGTGTVTLSATASSGTVKWYSAATGGTSLGSGNSYTTPSIAATNTYYAEADDNGCVSTSRTAVVATVITRPAAPISGGDISVCYGSDAEFKATQANNRCIDWYTASTGGTKLETCQTTYTKTNLTSDYTVYAEARIADNGCISASRTAIKATVNALPTASISGSDEVCQNGSLTLTGSGGTQYSWNNGAYSSTATYNVPTSTSGPQNITLKVKDSNNCESASADQKNVTVKTQPTAGTITSGDPVCKGSTVTLNVTNPSSASVQWQNSSKVDITGATGTSYKTPVLQESTDYYVKFTKDGCSSTSAKGTATVKAASLSLTATPAVVNPYTPVTLIAKNQSGTEETNSTWTITGAGSYFTESESPTDVSTVVMKPAKDVKTTVTATATVDGCPVSDTYSVTPTDDTETCN